MNLTFILFSILYIVSFCIFIYATIHKKHRFFFKTLTSFLFVLIYLFSNHIHPVMLLALIFCMLGDVLLGYTKNDKKVFMVPGLLSFLLAHIMYITVMNHFVGFHWFQLIFSIFGLVLLKIVTYTLDIHFGFKRYVIWLYTFIIFMTGSKALGLLYTHQNICMGIGGISFLISDFILLFLYFKYKNNKILQFSNSIIYYFAQYMFAISAYFM